MRSLISRRALPLLFLLAAGSPAIAGEIHKAAESGDIKTVKRLVSEKRERLAETDEQGSTPLHKAASAGHEEVVRYLIEQGAPVEARNSRGLTPLFSAGRAGRADIVRLLTRNGANVGALDADGLTPLFWAKTPEVAAILIEHGADINHRAKDGRSAVNIAINNRNAEMVEFLLRKGVDVRPGDPSAVAYNAAFLGENTILRILLEHGADPNATRPGLDATALHWAKDSVATALLLAHGAHVDARDGKGRTPLHHGPAANAIPLLLAHGAAIDARDSAGCTPLHYLFWPSAKILIDNGADVAARDAMGRTPLHYAAEAYDTVKINLLLARGLGVDVRDNAGYTALHTALLKGREDHIKQQNMEAELMRMEQESPRSGLGQPITIGSPDGGTGWETPIATIRFLLDRGCDINARASDGTTPLHIAASIGMEDAVTLLLDRGADAGIRNNTGETPLALARKALGIRTITLLKNRGAAE